MVEAWQWEEQLRKAWDGEGVKVWCGDTTQGRKLAPEHRRF